MSISSTPDVAILGAGTAGIAAWRAAAALTDRVLLIEGGPLGTTCARVGCMPSKLLIAAANAAHAVEQAHRFGVGVPGRAAVDGTAVMARVRRERDRFVAFAVAATEEIGERRLLRGKAVFTSAGTAMVDGTSIRAKAWVVATGSRPARPAQFDGLGDRLVVSDDVFEWQRLPESVAVVGAGSAGLEIGLALHRLGVRVRIFGQGGAVGPLTDPQVRDAARQVIGAEVSLHADARITALVRDGDHVDVTFVTEGETRTEAFEYVLLAVGRLPNVDGMGLERTGLALDARGVPRCNRHTLQCGESAFFLAGDVSAGVPVLHEATDEGAIAGANAARFPNVAPGQRRSRLSIVFTEPGIAVVGQAWADVEARRPIVGRASFADQGRSRILLVNEGCLQVYADRGTSRLLGAELVGPGAEHLAHLLAWVHQLELTVHQALALPFYHPAIEELLRDALRDAARQFPA